MMTKNVTSLKQLLTVNTSNPKNHKAIFLYQLLQTLLVLTNLSWI